MAGDTVIQRACHCLFETGRRRGTDETVENDRNPVQARAGDCPHHGSHLASAQSAQRLDPVALPPMQRDRIRDHLRLQIQARIVDARAASGPSRRWSPVQGTGNGRRRCRIANAHFPHDQHVGIDTHRVPPRRQCRRQLRVRHCGHLGEILCGAVKVKRMHIKPRVRRTGELIDRSTAMLEIENHLRSDLGWKSGNTTRRDPVIARENNDLGRLDLRTRIPAPTGIPLRQRLEIT